MAVAPTKSAGSIHRCDITPGADAEITSHSVGANSTLTNSWDDAAFINIYPKRRGHRIISRTLVHTALKGGKVTFSEMKLLFNSVWIKYCWCLHTENNFACHLLEVFLIHALGATLQATEHMRAGWAFLWMTQIEWHLWEAQNSYSGMPKHTSCFQAEGRMAQQPARTALGFLWPHKYCSWDLTAFRPPNSPTVRKNFGQALQTQTNFLIHSNVSASWKQWSHLNTEAILCANTYKVRCHQADKRAAVCNEGLPNSKPGVQQRKAH